MTSLRVVLISTYELGRQPFGLASPAAWLRAAGARVTCLDLAVDRLDEAAVADADLVAFYVPMHTATRLAAALVLRILSLNPRAHLCFYGLYAPLNESYLRGLGAQSIIGGEFEQGLVDLVKRLAAGTGETQQAPATISLAKQRFLVPERSDLPALDRYAYLTLGNGERRIVGYTEATRGCKHLCRHCPIPSVYGGVFRVVQADVVLEDIARQVALGAQHITFGDPDFFNGPGHALRIVTALHQRFPALTYDVTIKVEHMRRYAQHLPTLRETGCLFVTTAVEAIDDAILAILDKRHTRRDFIEVVAHCNDIGLALNPTFVTFTPWTTLRGYLELLAMIRELDLVDNVSPIQYGIRLLIPAGSRLLELPQVRDLVGVFDGAALCYHWDHPDPRVDRLCTAVLGAIQEGQRRGETRRQTFRRIWDLAFEACASTPRRLVQALEWEDATPRVLVPHLSEPWYC